MEQMQRNMEAALRNIADNTRHGDNQGGHEVNQYSSFKGFMDTKPPVFKEAVEQLEANEWINTMEQKFRLLRMTEELKAEYAAHQLQGPAGIWWSHHRTTYPEGTPITWNRFTTAFRENYIPPGVVEMKVGEFMKLSPGTKSVKEYLHAFNNLACYAPEFVNTYAKKIASFQGGLSPKMLKTMGTGTRATFNAYISDRLTQENNNNSYSASKSRKRAFEAGSSQSRAPVAGRQQYRPPAPGARFRPPQKRNTGHPTQQQKPYKVAVAPAKPRANQAAAPAANTMTKGPCYNCHKMGHLAKECPYSKKQQATYPARVHHTLIEEIKEGEPVTAGMFPVNQHLAVVLFDSGSSHSFMSQAFAQKHNQAVTDLGYGYCISSAGATLDISNHVFRVNLVVMPGLVLDVIMGMNWMKEWDVVIDAGKRVFSLREP